MWNLSAFIALFVGIGAGIAAWAGLSQVLGETPVAKGLSFTVGGLALSLFDFAIRWRSTELSARRFWSLSTGGWAVLFPVWIVGFVGLVGGVMLTFGGE